MEWIQYIFGVLNYLKIDINIILFWTEAVKSCVLIQNLGVIINVKIMREEID